MDFTDPCVNNGAATCKNSGNCTTKSVNLVNNVGPINQSNFLEFKCHCPTGWTGKICNEGINIDL